MIEIHDIFLSPPFVNANVYQFAYEADPQPIAIRVNSLIAHSNTLIDVDGVLYRIMSVSGLRWQVYREIENYCRVLYEKNLRIAEPNSI